jgi:hypothetical protein
MRSRTLASATVAIAACVVTGVYGHQPSVAHTAITAPACGKERWTVKTLSDADAAKVTFATVKPKGIAALARLKAPADVSSATTRTRRTERTVYGVTALLLSMRREDDSDIHLVIADLKSGGTMIAEFPATSCTTGARAKMRRTMKQARAALAAACGGLPGSGPVMLRGTATLTGVGFFDPIHGQSGVALNGIELHPVLTFKSEDCSRGSPTLPPG